MTGGDFSGFTSGVLVRIAKYSALIVKNRCQLVPSTSDEVIDDALLFISVCVILRDS